MSLVSARGPGPSGPACPVLPACWTEPTVLNGRSGSRQLPSPGRSLDESIGALTRRPQPLLRQWRPSLQSTTYRLPSVSGVHNPCGCRALALDSGGCISYTDERSSLGKCKRLLLSSVC
jgi:hypothetical protein